MAERTDPALIERAVQMYVEGATVPVVSRQLSVAESVLYRALHARGMKPTDLMRRGIRGKANRRFSDALEAEIATEYRAGASLNALASKHSVTIGTVRNALKRQGVERRHRGASFAELTEGRVAEMLDLWTSGMSQTAIGERFGMTQTAVSRALRAHGQDVAPRHARGARHGNWRGGQFKLGDYILVRVESDSPLAAMRNSGGYVMEHRLVMAQALGRPLRPSETVHHINGDTRDNRLENLQLRQGKHGNGVVMACLDCGSHNLGPVSLA